MHLSRYGKTQTSLVLLFLLNEKVFNNPIWNVK